MSNNKPCSKHNMHRSRCISPRQRTGAIRFPEWTPELANRLHNRPQAQLAYLAYTTAVQHWAISALMLVRDFNLCMDAKVHTDFAREEIHLRDPTELRDIAISALHSAYRFNQLLRSIASKKSNRAQLRRLRMKKELRMPMESTDEVSK